MRYNFVAKHDFNRASTHRDKTKYFRNHDFDEYLDEYYETLKEEEEECSKLKSKE